MDKKTPSRYQLISAFAAVYIIWGSTYLAIKFAIISFPPFLMAGFRFLISSVIIFGIARFFSKEKIKLNFWKDAFIIGGALLLGGNGGVVWAEQYVPSGLTALIVATVPIWMVLFDWLHPHGNKPTWKIIIGLVLGFAGLLIMISPTTILSGEKVNLYGAGALLFATCSWAAGSVYSRRADLPKSKFLTVAMEMFAGGILLLLAGTIFGEWNNFHIASLSTQSITAFFYLIAFGSVIGFTSYIWLLDAVGPARASTYAYVNPVIAVLLGWLIGGEEITSRIFFAAFFIILGVVFIITKKEFLRFKRKIK
ncbi:MAG: EamA family transporter [Ignavibacteriaceae bacterium]|nr:EamA family transporter [Ignavibacteriaceae bacterium]